MTGPEPTTPTDPATPADPAARADHVTRSSRIGQDILTAVERAVVGKRDALTLVLAGVLAGGHVLVEDNPGLGKTLAARSFAQALGLPFRRVQFTPDLLPSDVTGSYVYDQRDAQFVFRPGPLFTGLLLADELNRTPPKTQSALLEAMQERQVSVEGTTFELPAPFHVIATANPIEYEGTYPLPEAQLDRFLLRVRFGYPDADQEWEVLRSRVERATERNDVPQVVDADGLLALQAAVEQVVVDPTVGRYCVDLARASRSVSDVAVGASPRGALALLLTGRALALLAGRDFLLPEDVKAVAVAALAHRLTLTSDAWLRQRSPESIVTHLLDRVPAPPTVAPETVAPSTVAPGTVAPTTASHRARP